MTTKPQSLDDLFAEEEAQLLARAKAEIAAEAADPQHQAKVRAKIKEWEARPEPVETTDDEDEEGEES